MIALLAGLGIGVCTGITGTALVAMLLLRRGQVSATAEPIYDHEDAAEVIEVLTPHEAMRAEQLRNFGDRLAAGDTVLREQLRRFESGAR